MLDFFLHAQRLVGENPRVARLVVLPKPYSTLTKGCNLAQRSWTEYTVLDSLPPAMASITAAERTWCPSLA